MDFFPCYFFVRSLINYGKFTQGLKESCFFSVLFLRLAERKCENNCKICHLFTTNFSFIVRDFLIVKYLDSCCAGWTKMWDREKLCKVNDFATSFLNDENTLYSMILLYFFPFESLTITFSASPYSCFSMIM